MFELSILFYELCSSITGTTASWCPWQFLSLLLLYISTGLAWNCSSMLDCLGPVSSEQAISAHTYGRKGCLEFSPSGDLIFFFFFSLYPHSFTWSNFKFGDGNFSGCQQESNTSIVKQFMDGQIKGRACGKHWVQCIEAFPTWS